MTAPSLALVRPPDASLARCELTHLAREPIDLARARDEHAAYAALLAELGLAVQVLPQLPAHPDAPFVEDTAIVLEEVALLPRMGAPSRRGEQASVAAALAAHRPVEPLEVGTLDGGDVLRADDVLYVGQSSRTSHAALRALAHAVLAHGLRVKAVEVRGALHLKTAATWLGDGRLLVRSPQLNLARVRELELVEVPAEEPGGANVLRLGDALVVPAEFPRTAELLADLGYAVHTTPLREFAKAEAGPTCLSLLL